MEFALDQNGKRAHATSADKNMKYTCPVCGKDVIPRQGAVNIDHFAHISRCDDNWTYDMSDWHREWQEQFPAGNREIVIDIDGERHRTDIMAYGYALEFQHSSISAEEFDRRNAFYLRHGKKVIWIFDFVEEFNSKKMQCYEEWSFNNDNGGKFCWKHPCRFLKNFLPQEDENITVFFQTEDSAHEDAEACYIERATWAIKDDEGSSFKRFCTSYYPSNKAELLEWMRCGKL